MEISVFEVGGDVNSPDAKKVKKLEDSEKSRYITHLSQYFNPTYLGGAEEFRRGGGGIYNPPSLTVRVLSYGNETWRVYSTFKNVSLKVNMMKSCDKPPSWISEFPLGSKTKKCYSERIQTNKIMLK